MRKVFLGFFLVIFLLSIFGSVYAACTTEAGVDCPDCPEPGGLVPCGRSCDDPNTEPPGNCECEPCTLCHFFVMIEKWINRILFILVPSLAALMIAIGGGMYVIARGDPEMLSRAKKLFGSVVVGMIIIYGAWLIINLFFTVIGFSEFGLGLTGPDKWFKINCP